MLVVGLTGNIASGKSTVAEFLHKSGAVIIDADLIAHQVVAPGQPACEEISTLFGEGILRPDGTIDRERLGRLVFEDPGLRRQLEAIVHPRVSEAVSYTHLTLPTN